MMGAMSIISLFGGRKSLLTPPPLVLQGSPPSPLGSVSGFLRVLEPMVGRT